MLKAFVFLLAQKVADAYELAAKTGNWWQFITNPYVILFSPVFLLMLIMSTVFILLFISSIKQNLDDKYYEFKKFLNKKFEK